MKANILVIFFICLQQLTTILPFKIDPSFLLKQPKLTQKDDNNCDKNNGSHVLPSALIIGVKKSGTYAILRYLSVHPQIKAALKINDCPLNEIHYFDQDENYEQGLDWYRSQMPLVCCNKDVVDKTIVIEKTPGYFRSSKAPQRVYNYNPNIKLILIVREPVQRIKSELTHCSVRQNKFKNNTKCITMNRNLKHYFDIHLNELKLFNNHSYIELDNNKFIRNSVYYLDIKRWLQYFDIKNVLVIDGENFIRSPWIELNKVEQFLGLTQFIDRKHFKFNRKKGFYCLAKEQKSILKPNSSTFPEIDGCLGKNKGRNKHIHLSDSVKEGLKIYFTKWNRLFFDTIGNEFNW
jgi:[heparan sulfate]-glucosamine 3-sulfotransferase 1